MDVYSSGNKENPYSSSPLIAFFYSSPFPQAPDSRYKHQHIQAQIATDSTVSCNESKRT